MFPSSVVAFSDPQKPNNNAAKIARTRSADAVVDTFARRPSPLQRRQSAPPSFNLVTPLGRQLVDSLQIVGNTAREIVTTVQAVRTDLNMPLLSDVMSARLESSVRARLRRSGFAERIGRKLQKHLSEAKLAKLVNFFATEGVFFRDGLTPLAHEIERARLGWQAQRAAGVPTPKRAEGARRTQLDRVMSLVYRLRPAAQGDPGLCDVLAGLILLRLDHAGRTQLRHYLHALARQDITPLLDQISAWVLDACRRDGSYGWVLSQVDALVDLESCDQAIAKNREALPPIRRRAELYLDRLEDPHMALRDMKRLVKLKPCADHYVARAKVYVQLRQWDAAQADLDEAMQLEPRHAGAYGWRSMLRLRRHDIAAAERDLRRGERRDPQDPDVCLAKLQLEEHRLTARLEDHPQDAQAYLDRAQCRGKQSRYAEALADCRAALELSPHNPHALEGCDLWAGILGIDAH